MTIERFSTAGQPDAYPAPNGRYCRYRTARAFKKKLDAAEARIIELEQFLEIQGLIIKELANENRHHEEVQDTGRPAGRADQ